MNSVVHAVSAADNALHFVVAYLCKSACVMPVLQREIATLKDLSSATDFELCSVAVLCFVVLGAWLAFARCLPFHVFRLACHHWHF